MGRQDHVEKGAFAQQWDWLILSRCTWSAQEPFRIGIDLPMMILLVVNDPKEWPLKVPGVEVVAARSYLVKLKYAELSGAKVFNFCRSYRYQGSRSAFTLAETWRANTTA